jgi:hypothetical protein
MRFKAHGLDEIVANKINLRVYYKDNPVMLKNIKELEDIIFDGKEFDIYKMALLTNPEETLLTEKQKEKIKLSAEMRRMERKIIR